MEDNIVNVADGDVSDMTEIDEVTHMSQSDEVVTHTSETHFHDKRCQLEEDDDSAIMNCSQDCNPTNHSEMQHTVTFKCIGTMHDFHAQSTLCRVSQMIDKGDIVPVNIYPEPSNCYDSKAIAIKC